MMKTYTTTMLSIRHYTLTLLFQNAKYFCTGCIDDESLYRHYALNVPLYTHFTSPIRRYPDVIVHRLLGATLGKKLCVYLVVFLFGAFDGINNNCQNMSLRNTVLQ